MINFFIPTQKNGYKAYLMKTPVLLLFVFIIASFNFVVKVNVNAQSNSQEINTENLLNAHNRQRTNLRIKELTLDAKLEQSAQNKANALLESNCWSHYCPDGKSPWDFFKDAGYDFVIAGENLAEGFFNIDDVMTAWMNSKTHRDNILNADYKDVGFGIAKGNYQGLQNNIIVVAHFGSTSADILADQSKQLLVTFPKDDSTLNQNNTNVEGVVKDLSEVNIFLNGLNDGKASIDNGFFTYNLKSLREGSNFIYAESPLELGLSKDSNVVKVTYDPTFVSDNINQSISVDFNSLTSTPQLKNLINLMFIVGLGSLFLLDFLVLSRTKILGEKRSLTHYHFGLFIILAIIVLAGGFAGTLGQALSI